MQRTTIGGLIAIEGIWHLLETFMRRITNLFLLYLCIWSPLPKTHFLKWNVTHIPVKAAASFLCLNHSYKLSTLSWRHAGTLRSFSIQGGCPILSGASGCQFNAGMGCDARRPNQATIHVRDHARLRVRQPTMNLPWHDQFPMLQVKQLLTWCLRNPG